MVKLFEEEQMAFDIVTNHARATMDGCKPKQLLMLLRGLGGTGKMVTIKMISEMFRQNGMEEWLAITATWGVAVTLIEGVTLPITPMEMGFSIQDGKKTIAVTQRQFAMTAAYADMHEKAHGQMLGTILVDLAPHPGGELTPFHCHVIEEQRMVNNMNLA
ncbi:hypothetical protein C8J56DRAFT_1037208 [Mycena floridula]|nr:hypothetical protein C8J56DRAFT_1037208 [Mycena floridula]